MNANTSERKTCFLSYPFTRGYREVFTKAVLPTLRRHGWETLDPRTRFAPGDHIHDWIVKAIRSCQLVLCDFSDASPNTSYEIGLANAWGKRTIILSRAIEKVPFDIATKFPMLLYSADPEGVEAIAGQLGAILAQMERDRPTLEEPSLLRYVDRSSAISIEVFSQDVDALDVLGHTYRLLRALADLEDLHGVTIQEMRTGSLGTWLAANIDKVTSLVEKLVFFVPEWKKKMAGKIRIDAESDLLRARAEYVRAQADEVRMESNRKNAEALLEVLRATQDVGATRLTLGDMLSLETRDDGSIWIGPPSEDQRSRDDSG